MGCMKGIKDLLRILDDNRVLSSGPWSSLGRIVWGYGTNCGEPIDPWDAWCRHCGAELEDE